MRKKTRKEKNTELKRRYDLIKNMMSTLTMATVTFVAAIVLIPVSAKAEIIRLESTNTQVIYQVQVTDIEESLDVSTLFVVLENQLEYYEQHISLGEYSGYFDDLNEDTSYTLSIYGNKGFGLERLTSSSVKTNPIEGGVILQVTPVIYDYFVSYKIMYEIADQNNVYQDYVLRYEYTSHHEEEIYSTDILLNEVSGEIELDEIYTEDVFQIYLIGINGTEEEIFDQVEVTPPFSLHSSLYVTSIHQNEIGFQMYFDERYLNQTYKVNVYQDDLMIQTLSLLSKAEFDEYSSIFIDELSEGVVYRIECVTELMNPQTLRIEEFVIFDEEIETLKHYDYIYNIDQYEEFIIFEIELNDPEGYFDYIYYEVYDGDTYIESNQMVFMMNENIKTGFFEIFLPVGTSYDIYIEMRSNNDYRITHIIYDSEQQ